MDPGGKVDKIEKCLKEISLALKSYGLPIIRMVPEQGLVYVELLTKPYKDVSFSELLPDLHTYKAPLPVILGRTQAGENLLTDLSKMPHLLIAGTTGSGKSVMLHSIITSLILCNKEVELALVDPKTVELSYYKSINNLKYPIVHEADMALHIVNDLVAEMNLRFAKMSKVMANNIEMYNTKVSRKLPYIVLVIDEFSDLMHQSDKEFTTQLCILAQKSRACGIHIILATQRPSKEVVTGLIKANFPGRISCKVTSNVDSRVILDCSGAERLLGNGDSFIRSPLHDMIRFKGAFISPDEIQDICSRFKKPTWRNLL